MVAMKPSFSESKNPPRAQELNPESSPRPEVSVVLPCWNEEANVERMAMEIAAVLPSLRIEIIFVDDGSADGTANAVRALRTRDPRIRLISFVRNAGHQSALRAGYRAARGEYVVTMDADGQHPPEYLPIMISKAKEGYDVVQMVRLGGQAGFAKNLFSQSFYRFFNAIADEPIPEAGSDYRLISRQVCETLNALPERNLVLRAALPALGFSTAMLNYTVKPRQGGGAGYTFGKSWRLMSDTVFNYSTLPLRLMRRLGLAISVLAFGYGLFNVIAKFFGEGNVPGYTDIIASVLFLGGLVLLYLGILGRYLEIAIDHLRGRPEYLLRADPERGSESEPR